MHTLSDSQIHIWTAAIGQYARDFERLQAFLSEEELKRSHRFRYQADRLQFVCSHAIVRLILARYIDHPPNRIDIITSPRGKPHVQASWIHFNLSHTHQMAVVAVSCCPVGIDVECLSREIDNPLAIAQRYFTQSEFAMLLAVPELERLYAFLALWVRKEACVKAAGFGLQFPLNQFDVTRPSGVITLPALPKLGVEATQWKHCELRLPDGFVGSVVGSARAPCVSYFDSLEAHILC